MTSHTNQSKIESNILKCRAPFTIWGECHSECNEPKGHDGMHKTTTDNIEIWWKKHNIEE